MIPSTAFVLMLAATLQSDATDERMYGRVATEDGDVYEGFIQWDEDKASWSDFLDGDKTIPWEHLRQAEEADPEEAALGRSERSIEAFGVRITWDRDEDALPVLAASTVRFGRLRAMAVIDNRSARLELKGGEQVELRSRSTHLGRRMRGLVVYEPGRDPVGLRWRDLARVDFMRAPDGASPAPGRRLHGTLTTRSGRILTGFVAWDRDEAFASDVLEGMDADYRRRHRIAFGDVATIEWESSSSARVVRRDGTVLVLYATSDVDEGNRGIEITDPTFGRAIVPWEELGVVEFHTRRAAPAGYDTFHDPGALRGTVHTVGGEAVTGRIRWNNVEAAGWEALGGWSDGVEYELELGAIRSIRKLDSWSAEVTLVNGSTLELTDSEEFDRGNRGIFVTGEGGRTVVVGWEDFDRADFQW